MPDDVAEPLGDAAADERPDRVRRDEEAVDVEEVGRAAALAVVIDVLNDDRRGVPLPNRVLSSSTRCGVTGRSPVRLRTDIVFLYFCSYSAISSPSPSLPRLSSRCLRSSPATFSSAAVGLLLAALTLPRFSPLLLSSSDGSASFTRPSLPAAMRGRRMFLSSSNCSLSTPSTRLVNPVTPPIA